MHYDAAIIQIGAKHPPLDGITQATFTILKFRAANPEAKITLWVHGYDDDPRELWEVPEVCVQIKQVIGRVLRARPRWDLNDLNLDEHSQFLVGMCYGILRITGRNPENGNYTTEVIGGKQPQ